MSETLEEIKANITTQFKLLELAEKSCERILKRNKKSEIEKHLHHVETRLEVLQDLKYSGQEKMLSSSDETEDLEEWSSILEEKMARYDNVVNILKEAVRATGKKEEDEVKR